MIARAVTAFTAICLTFACGSDGASSDAAPIDAAPTPDVRQLPDGGNTNGPYELLSCDEVVADAGVSDGGVADAGADPDASVADAGAMADAGPQPDAGPMAGIDDPCCDPDGMCMGDLACIAGPAAETHRCRPRCDLEVGSCPSGGACASFGGQGVCLPASTVGEPCAPELCDDASICVGETADDAVCRKRCQGPDDCDGETTCTELQGTDSKACL